MDLETTVLTLQTIGSIFVAYAALRVHHRVLAEHRIDNKVLGTMRVEQIVGWGGVFFLLAGYGLHFIGIML